MRILISKATPILYIWSQVIVLILSWWLLFRDDRAVHFFSINYPNSHQALVELQKWLQSHGLNLIPSLVLLGVSVFAFLLYGLSLSSNFSLKKTSVVFFLSSIILVFSYPILSTDIFSYIASSRVQSTYGANPWSTIPQTYMPDAWIAMGDWNNSTLVYGAVHQIIFKPAQILGNDDPLLTLFLYKLTAALFVWASFGLTIVIFKNRFSTDDLPRTLRLLFWNPLLLIELFGSAHNESLLLFFTLLSIYYLQHKRWWLAGIALAAAMQVKIIPLLVVPFVGLWLILSKKFKALIHFALAIIAVNFACSWYMQLSVMDYVARALENNHILWQSIQAMLARYLGISSFSLIVPFVLFYAVIFLLQIRKSLPPFEAYLMVLAFFLVAVTSAYWNWYVLWALMIVPFTNDRQIRISILTLSFTSLLAYPLLMVSYRFNYRHPFWPIFLWHMLFGPPILSLFFVSKKKVKDWLPHTNPLEV